jgi:hypothetical protein
MKKVILSLASFMVLSTSYSQIVVDEPTKDSVVYSYPLTTLKLIHFYGKPELDHYAFYYKNTKYQYITDVDYISFNTKEDVVEFFNLLLKVSETGEFTSFTLDGKRYYIAKRMGQLAVYDDKSTSEFLITKKIVNKILIELQ